MQEDIKRYFGITIKEEIRNTSCYILKKSEVFDLSKLAKRKREIASGNSDRYVSISELVKLSNNYLDRPLLNETGLSEDFKLELILPLNPSDPNSLIGVFLNAGFEVIQEQRDIIIMVTKCQI